MATTYNKNGQNGTGGGGAGSSSWSQSGGTGGGGLVVIQYPAPSPYFAGGTVTSDGTTVTHVFDTPGNFSLSPLS
jgi:hypothetical protein